MAIRKMFARVTRCDMFPCPFPYKLLKAHHLRKKKSILFFFKKSRREIYIYTLFNSLDFLKKSLILSKIVKYD